MNGTEFPLIAHAELNDPDQVIPLTEVLSKVPVVEINRFVALGNRKVKINGVEMDTPYHDLFFRCWTRASKLFNNLLRYERALCLEELQRELQGLSRGFDVALQALLGCGLKWHVDLLQPISEETLDSLPSCRQAFTGTNTLPLFVPPMNFFKAATVYALLSMLVLEVRFQEMERLVRDLLELDATDTRIDGLNLRIEEMREAIQKAPSTLLVLHMYNPFQDHDQGFKTFIVERYQELQDSASHFWMLGFLALIKTASVLCMDVESIAQMTRSNLKMSECMVSDQKTLDFIYKTSGLQQPAPIVRREKLRPFRVSTVYFTRDETGDTGLSSETVINGIRAKCLKRLGHRLDWSQIDLMPLPEDWVPSTITELDENDLDDPNGDNTGHWPFARALVSFCCLRF